jgi:endonuclease/exonuclease/phosphatase family metal-dependent hydrolase
MSQTNHSASDSPVAVPMLRVMTFNTANDFVDPIHLLALLREYKADIIALVELSPTNAEVLRENLQVEYPYRVLYGKKYDGKGLLSRYPIEQDEYFTLLTERSHIECLLNINGQMITVFVVHAPAPNYRQFERQSAYCEPEINLLIQRGKFDRPTMYLGDFNFIDRSATYRLMVDAGLTDTFRAVGSGTGYTFPTRFQYLPVRLPLLVRIDYIWVTKHFQPLSSRVALGYGSDHLPVISELKLTTTHNQSGQNE